MRLGWIQSNKPYHSIQNLSWTGWCRTEPSVMCMCEHHTTCFLLSVCLAPQVIFYHRNKDNRELQTHQRGGGEGHTHTHSLIIHITDLNCRSNATGQYGRTPWHLHYAVVGVICMLWSIWLTNKSVRDPHVWTEINNTHIAADSSVLHAWWS